MPCLIALLVIFAPRVLSVVLALFTNWFDAAFSGRLLLLVLGIVFLPITTLTYAWIVRTEGGVHSTFSIVLMVVAALIDLSSWEGGRRSRRPL